MTEEMEKCIRFIRAKLPAANERQLIIIANLIRRMHIVGWSESEYNRKP